jgi:hypothetical protein
MRYYPHLYEYTPFRLSIARKKGKTKGQKPPPKTEQQHATTGNKQQQQQQQQQATKPALVFYPTITNSYSHS